jgi:hypothetical protein
MLHRSHRVLLPLLLLLVLVAACASPPQAPPTSQASPSPKAQALQALNLDKQIYDSTFQTLALLDRQGKLPAAAKAKAIRLGNLYMQAHNAAVQALLADGTANLATVRAALDLFLDAATPYLLGVE